MLPEDFESINAPSPRLPGPRLPRQVTRIRRTVAKIDQLQVYAQ
jgi:hypothetical protein